MADIASETTEEVTQDTGRARLWRAIRRWFERLEETVTETPYTGIGLDRAVCDTAGIAARVAAVFAELRLPEGNLDTGDFCHLDPHELDRLAAAFILKTPQLRQLLDALLDRLETRRQLLLETTLPESHGTLMCNRCGLEINTVRRFCSRCGNLLWQLCPSCSSLMAVTDEYCGECGGRIADAEEQMRRQWEADQHAAARLWQEGQHTAALQKWFQWAACREWQKEPFGRMTVLCWLEHFEKWQTCNAHAEKMLQRALQCEKAGDWRKQLALYEQIPEVVIPEDVRRKRDALRCRHRELVQLEGELRNSIQQKQWLLCGRLVNRILQLDPCHSAARSCASKLSRILLRTASDLLARGERRKAHRVLSAIPNIGHNEEFNQLCRRCDELEWLEQELSHASDNDPATAQLRKIAEKYGIRAAKVAALRTAQSQTAQPSRDVAKSPLGFQACFVSRLPYVTWDAPAGQENGATHQFVTSIGLALQALERERAIPALYTVHSRRFIPWRRAPSYGAAWGVDLGTWSVKWVRLASDEKGYRVTLYDQRPCPSPHTHNFWHINGTENIYSLLEPVKKCIDDAGTNAEPLVFSLPGHSVLTRYARLPARGKDLEAMILYELKSWLPFPAEEILWTFHSTTDSRRNNSSHVTILATRKRTVECLGEQLRSLFPDRMIMIQYAGAAHSLIMQVILRGNSCATAQPAALLDLGHGQSLLTLCLPERIVCRQLIYGGHVAMKMLCRELQSPAAQISALLASPYTHPELLRIGLTLEKAHATLYRELSAIWQSLREEGIPLPADLYVCGGLSVCLGLRRVLVHGAAATPDTWRLEDDPDTDT
ncbi:MAG: hypothetical protein KatS3mg110_2855 [Pirellulaceae bacterium]|nr:MAG: hypothetical protein KatS3mg110_2855 [Pirellulaceae bacterium]